MEVEPILQRDLKVVVVEDEPLYLDLLKVSLSHEPGIDIVRTFFEGEECVEWAGGADFDVALLDIELAGAMNGIEVGLRLRERLPQAGIVILSNHRDPAFLHAFREGRFSGWSYLLKKSVSNVEALQRAIVGAAAGMVVLDPNLIAGAVPRRESRLYRLTPRQREILDLMAQGYSNAGIAEKLVISVKTVENHINVLYQEFQVDRNSAYHARVLTVLAYLEQLNFPPPAV